jgi:hypothetical protein
MQESRLVQGPRQVPDSTALHRSGHQSDVAECRSTRESSVPAMAASIDAGSGVEESRNPPAVVGLLPLWAALNTARVLRMRRTGDSLESLRR